VRRYNPAALAQNAVFHERYQIVRCIKAGGMGAVYECIHLSTRKRRALKVMLPEMVDEPGMRDRFELEARVTAEIESEHIVETFDAGVDEATRAPFLVMELLRGDDLGGLLSACGAFSAEETVVLLSQAALALDKTHAAGIVHRDLKPQNLFLTARDDGSPRLKILDFGVAKVVAEETLRRKLTAAVGTPVFMSPEQATGDGAIGPPTDLYALGQIAYALLTGHVYWMEEQKTLSAYAFLTAMIAGVIEPPSLRAGRRGVALPGAFDAWFARATARSPGDRFPGASTQIAELATALGTAAPSTLLAAPSSLTRRLLTEISSVIRHASGEGSEGLLPGSPPRAPSPPPPAASHAPPGPTLVEGRGSLGGATMMMSVASDAPTVRIPDAAPRHRRPVAVTAARIQGRLIELRTAPQVALADVDDLIRRLTPLFAEVEGRLVTCLDLRASPVLLPAVSDRMLELLRRGNPRIERSAFLLAPDKATLALQVERMLRESNNPNRRAFRDQTALRNFLEPVLDRAERDRLASFLDGR
jgi:serine/threonine-protein kinase